MNPPPSSGASPVNRKPIRDAPKVVFDASHGQPNWAQTGFASREMHTNFAGVAETLGRLGCDCVSSAEQRFARCLAGTKLLVVPPPTGRYHARKQAWVPHPSALFTAADTAAVHSFLAEGGRLLLFAYRFGDAFTHGNVRELIGPLGCLLNEDVVIDLPTLRVSHPLQAHFDTSVDCLPLSWSLDHVTTVRWRVMATFTILPRTTAWPLALSPGGRCISFNRAHRQIHFDSLPIAVAGVKGKGRYVLVGGPHVFETGTFGLLGDADNARFLENVLRWLLDDKPAAVELAGQTQAVLTAGDHELCCVESGGPGRSTVAYVERQLRTSGLLKALYRPQWMP